MKTEPKARIEITAPGYYLSGEFPLSSIKKVLDFASECIAETAKQEFDNDEQPAAKPNE